MYVYCIWRRTEWTLEELDNYCCMYIVYGEELNEDWRVRMGISWEGPLNLNTIPIVSVQLLETVALSLIFQPPPSTPPFLLPIVASPPSPLSFLLTSTFPSTILIYLFSSPILLYECKMYINIYYFNNDKGIESLPQTLIF